MEKEFWENRWETSQIGWDMGEVSPSLKEYFDQLKDKSISILIPGCGNAYEAEYLHQQGFKNVFIVEIAQGAIDSFIKRCPNFPKEHIIHANFFDLDQSFDLVIEQTFFCAINPIQRNDYADKMAEIIKPNGKLVGLLFDKEFEGGPPFSGSKQEYIDLFSSIFNIQIIEKSYNSYPPRQGSELFIKLQNK